ncbi:hypothetical protein EVAR_44107_1 [Eumeta japonica]|uniref:Uncharacterized protein n=1 Tax=Eumeta variegata TaxID=151549 RepID=A0A4C1X4I7_EUMVA|nr:hypothetical protein EVAR_44107_1 [Eumeta japonica]
MFFFTSPPWTALVARDASEPTSSPRFKNDSRKKGPRRGARGTRGAKISAMPKFGMLTDNYEQVLVNTRHLTDALFGGGRPRRAMNANEGAPPAADSLHGIIRFRFSRPAPADGGLRRAPG